ncbi:MAG: glycosyltransferase [Chloroflexi bacterium]|nr:glycosyltransferase [Ktedonobacteraceae bacterium]MBV9707298.1 glycosyltransferase [Chloroflexota bacterium]
MGLSVIQVIGNSVVGGAERHVRDLVQGMRMQGISVEVVCPRPGPLTEHFATNGVPVHYVEMVRSWPYDEYLPNQKAMQELTVLLKQRRPDVVHSHLYPAHIHASIAAQRACIQAIIHTAHTIIVRPGDAILSYVTTARTIAVSQTVARLLENVGVLPERIEVIYNGVGSEHFEDNLQAQQRVREELQLGNGPIIGVVARLSMEKGIDVLLHAIQQVVHTYPELTLLIVGDGPQAAELRELADRLGLHDTVRFLGARSDIPIVNRLLDVFILPSREEACPMALLEAMAAGRAVITTQVGGNPEVVTHDVDGLLIPPDNPTALSQALLMLIPDQARRTAMGDAAHQKVCVKFTRERMIHETLSFYQRLLADGSSESRVPSEE